MADAHGQLAGDQGTATHQATNQGSDPVTDDELVRQARAQPAAFAELYRRHLPRVYRYLLARLGDEQVAQDATAQTFLAALEGLAGYRGQDRFAAWLLGIARNKAGDVWRGRAAAALPLEAAERVEAGGPSPEQIVAGRLELEAALRAMRTLTPERAEALALRVFGGLSVAEVGAVMGKGEAAVKMLVHRAVRDLRARLAYGSEAER